MREGYWLSGNTNASLGSLVEKTPVDTVRDHIEKVIRENDQIQERDKHTKETPQWKSKEIEQRHKRQKEQYKDQAGNKNRGRYLS